MNGMMKRSLIARLRRLLNALRQSLFSEAEFGANVHKFTTLYALVVNEETERNKLSYHHQCLKLLAKRARFIKRAMDFHTVVHGNNSPHAEDSSLAKEVLALTNALSETACKNDGLPRNEDSMLDFE